MSVDTALTTGAPGAAVSIATVLVPAALALPAASVATALMVLLAASAGISALAKFAVHAPADEAVTVFTVVPQVTATLAPASAVPATATPAVFSAALTALSVDTALTTGAEGAVASTLTETVVSVLLLPAPSLAYTTTLAVPSAGTEAAETVVVQTPLAFVFAVAVAVPHVTVTTELASAVPEMVTPAAFAAAFTTLAEPIELTFGASGGVVSEDFPLAARATPAKAATHPLPAEAAAVAASAAVGAAETAGVELVDPELEEGAPEPASVAVTGAPVEAELA